MNVSASKITRMLLSLLRCARVFPYGGYLITVLPVFAVLAEGEYVNDVWALLRILPFVFAMAAGFTYNTVCDARTDPKDKNPISRGDLTPRTAAKAVIFETASAIVSFAVIYQSVMSFVLFGIYILLWFAYSGLGIRLKESMASTAVASYVLWVGPPLTLLSGYDYFPDSLMFLLAGLFLIYIGHEIKHTVIEHDMDISFGLKTFSVIVGRERSTVTEYVMLLLGYALLLCCIPYLDGQEGGCVALAFSVLFALSICSTVFYGHRVRYAPRRDSIFVTLPYVSTKIFIIAVGLLVLDVPELLSFFIIWLYLTRRYP